MQEAIDKVNVLMEALPYVRRFRGKLVIIKYGGSLIANEERKKDIIQDIVFMSFVGIRPILVHGGGPAISEAMKAKGRVSKFVSGLRVTDKETLGIVEKILMNINKDIVSLIKKTGAGAIGFSAKQKGFIKAKRVKGDLGYVGEVVEVNKKLLDTSRSGDGVIPVIASMASGEGGETLNVNADEVAAEIACSGVAEKLVLVTDVAGIMVGPEEEESLISTLKIDRLEELMKKGVISGGMIPKVKACVRALKSGVKKAHIIDGKISHALLLEIFTDKGIGTEIVK